MKNLLCLLALVLPMAAHAATVGAVGSTNALIQNINPNSALTNYFTVGDTGVIADGSAAIWTYDASSNVDDTNHIKPLLYGGRWVRNPMGGTNSYSFLVGVAQTNYTIIGRTNVKVTQVISGTNSTIYLDSGGGGTTINPTDGYAPYRLNATTFADDDWYHISTNKLGFNSTNIFLFYTPDGTYPLRSMLALGEGTLTNLDPLVSFAGSSSIGIGDHAMSSTRLSAGSTALGWEAATDSTNFVNSTAIGYVAGDALNAVGLVSIGNSAGPGFALSTNDTIVGFSAAASLGLGIVLNSSDSTSIGANTLFAATGVSITVVGSSAGLVTQGTMGIRDRSFSTFIGAFSGQNQDGGAGNLNITNAVSIGYNVPATNSNEIVIGNVSNTAAFIPGVTNLAVIGGVSWYVGAGVPGFTAPNGSYFSRTDGGAGSTFYVREGGSWAAK